MYKLYPTKRTKYLEQMLSEGCFVWNHALELHKRYHKIYGEIIHLNKIIKHFQKRIKRNLLSANCRNEILERLDASYTRFFKKISKRPPKFRSKTTFASIVFCRVHTHGYEYLDNCRLYGNVFFVNCLKREFKFYKSRDYDGIIRKLTLKRNRLGEYFICITTDKGLSYYGKTHNGASVGIDFGLKKYLTLSDGTAYENPMFLNRDMNELRTRCRKLSLCKNGSNNKERRRKDLDRLWNNICNRRTDFQWKLAHELCRKYDRIFIEDLQLDSMNKLWGRKMKDLAHAEFVQKLEYVATKYGVLVHKIDRFYPSSKTCTCGYIYKDLKLSERRWTCPICGAVHDRDLLAANNILRRGIYELESGSKTLKRPAKRLSRLHPTISSGSMPNVSPGLYTNAKGWQQTV